MSTVADALTIKTRCYYRWNHQFIAKNKEKASRRQGFVFVSIEIYRLLAVTVDSSNNKIAISKLPDTNNPSTQYNY